MAAQSAADVASSAARADGASVEDAGGNGVEAIGSADGPSLKPRNPKQPEATPQQRSKSGKIREEKKQENNSIPFPSIATLILEIEFG